MLITRKGKGVDRTPDAQGQVTRSIDLCLLSVVFLRLGRLKSRRRKESITCTKPICCGGFDSSLERRATEEDDDDDDEDDDSLGPVSGVSRLPISPGRTRSPPRLQILTQPHGNTVDRTLTATHLGRRNLMNSKVRFHEPQQPPIDGYESTGSDAR